METSLSNNNSVKILHFIPELLDDIKLTLPLIISTIKLIKNNKKDYIPDISSSLTTVLASVPSSMAPQLLLGGRCAPINTINKRNRRRRNRFKANILQKLKQRKFPFRSIRSARRSITIMDFPDNTNDVSSSPSTSYETFSNDLSNNIESNTVAGPPLLNRLNLNDFSQFNADSSDSDNENENRQGLIGLKNIGNTCFMNSVLQCLSHTRELEKFLRSDLLLKRTSIDENIFFEFAILIQKLWSSKRRIVFTYNFKRALSYKYHIYSRNFQQDAQEFLRYLLDSLHSATNIGIKGEPYEIDDNLSDDRKASLTWNLYTKTDNSIIKDLFVGQLKSTFKCTVCHNTSVTFEPFWDLSVPISSLSNKCELNECLESFFKIEVLDDDEMPTCSKCQRKRKCTKSYTIQRFPKYLVIHLKRFSQIDLTKIRTIVKFPTGVKGLDMSRFANDPNSSMAFYSLYATSNHMGSSDGGHYVAFCKHSDTNKWYAFDDDIVGDEISERYLVSSSAYILFYERASN